LIVDEEQRNDRTAAGERSTKNYYAEDYFDVER
jgi:hypothetical protein